MTPRRTDTIRAAARGCWPDIFATLGIDPALIDGRNRPCPGCGGRDRFQFNRRSDVGTFSCRNHPKGGGDGFALVQHVFEVGFSAAARLVAEALGMDAGNGELPRLAPPPRLAMPTPADDCIRQREKAGRLWHEAKAITANDPAGRYLTRRRLPLPEHGDALRFHPALPYLRQSDNGEPELIGRPPAMVALIIWANGEPAGLHRIYLEPDGGKFAVDGLPSKKIMKAGNLHGAAVRLAPPTDGRLWITEGIEDAAAVMALSDIPAWAALSASMMPGIWLPDDVDRVYIGADADPAGQRAAHALAERLNGEGRKVWICTPPAPFKDWNEALIAGEACHAA
jgi:putative DNA primase/helicase